MKLSNLIVVSTLFLISCGTNEPKESVPTKTDTLLEQSDIVIKNAEGSAKKIDSVTNVTSEKLNNNIEVLTKTIDNYKVESQKIKTTIKEKIVYKTDTVFIETKKNFWGKTKKNVTTTSDSSVNLSESVSDTLINN